MFERSKKLVPVHLRTKKLDYAIPARALCSYKTKEAGDMGLYVNTYIHAYMLNELARE